MNKTNEASEAVSYIRNRWMVRSKRDRRPTGEYIPSTERPDYDESLVERLPVRWGRA